MLWSFRIAGVISQNYLELVPVFAFCTPSVHCMFLMAARILTADLLKDIVSVSLPLLSSDSYSNWCTLESSPSIQNVGGLLNDAYWSSRSNFMSITMKILNRNNFALWFATATVGVGSLTEVSCSTSLPGLLRYVTPPEPHGAE